MRPASGLSAQIWHLPLVLPRSGASWRDSWGFEVVLVEERLLAICFLRRAETLAKEGRFGLVSAAADERETI